MADDDYVRVPRTVMGNHGEFVRRDVYEANRETAEREREALARDIKNETRVLEKDIGGVKDDIKDIKESIKELKDQTRWLLRSVGAAVIMVAGNFVFLMLTRAA